MAARKNPGFTLVELSIVLVIIGLVIGGVLVGRDLILAAQIKKQAVQIESFKTAIMTFRSKYGGLPGDLANATSYFTADPNCDTTGGPGLRAYLAASNGKTCDGNGDGIISGQNGANPEEMELIWQHLNLAGLIPGAYTGTCGYAGQCAYGSYVNMVSNVSNPSPVLRPGIISLLHMSEYPDDFPALPPKLPQNAFFIEGCAYPEPDGSGPCFSDPPYYTWVGTDGAFTPKEGYMLDKKFDDGLPQTGAILNGAQPWNGLCNDSSTPSKWVNSDVVNCPLLWDAGF